MKLMQLSRISILVGLTVCIYFWSLGNPFIWDDQQFIYGNSFVTEFELPKLLTESITSGAGVMSTYYRPLLALSFAFDYQFWGANPVAFRAVNVLLHTAAGYLLWKVLQNWQLSYWARLLTVGSFLLHPVQTEAVTYINSRGDSLAAMLSLLGLWCWQQHTLGKTSAYSWLNIRVSAAPRTLGILSSGCFVAALLSKEIAVAAFGLPILWHIQLLTTQKNSSHLKMLGYWIVTSCLWILGYIVVRTQLLPTPIALHQTSQNSTGLIQRLWEFSGLLMEYLMILIWPHPLHMERFVNTSTNAFHLQALGGIVFIASVLWMAKKEYQRFQTAWALIGLLWFVGLLLPVSGIVPINGQIYEHWLYLPQVGFWLMAYSFYSLFLRSHNVTLIKAHQQSQHYSLSHTKESQTITLKSKQQIIWCLLILWMTLTCRQNYLWGNPIRFYEYTLQYARTARLYTNLGMSYAARADHMAALDSYRLSLEIEEYPQTWHNMGNTYRSLGNNQEALNSFARARELDATFWPSYQAAAQLLEQSGSPQQAQELLNSYNKPQ